MSFRPALRPGAPLLRRDATHLQVGTSPGVVVADRPGLVTLLRMLDGVRDVERIVDLARDAVPELGDGVPALLTDLLAAGVVVDASALAVVDRRRATRSVGLDHDTGTAPLLSVVRSVLTSAGVGHVDAAAPDLLVIASWGEAARATYERAALLRVDHLPVVVDEDRVRIGPLVRPGRTPCVSCHDLHRADWDPAWAVLLHQLGRRPPAPRPSALDPLTSHSAAVEVAAEVLAHLDGLSPRTLGRCLVVGPRHDERVVRPVTFHHRCACDLLNAA